MADSNIAGLPAGAAITDTDLIAGSNAGSGTLVKKTGLQFNTYIRNMLSSLPTTDPHIIGELWNNGGVVAISQPFTRSLAGNTGTYALTGATATLNRNINWYVDSVAGSDSNNGQTTSTPFATLAKVGTAVALDPTATGVALKRGSHFRESMSTAMLAIVDYDVGALPIIDGSDVITGWTVNGSHASVWEKAVTIDTGGRPRIYEDGVVLPWVADLATCASTDGSRVLLNDGGSVTLQMNPTGAGNPNSNGKTYEATVRSAPVNMGDNSILIGVHARRAISNDGAIQLARDGRIENCVSSQGSKHNILIGSGSIVDTIAIEADAVTPSEPSNVFIVGYDSRGIPGHSLTMTRVGFVAPASGTQASFISHDNGGGAYDSVTAEQIWLSQSGIFGPGASSITIRGYFSDRLTSPIGSWFSSQITIDYAQIKNVGFGTDTGFTGSDATSNLSPQFFKLRESVFYSEGSNDAWFRLQSGMNGENITVKNTALVTSVGASRRHMSDEGWSTGTFTVQQSIFITSPFGAFLVVPTGISYVADDNVIAKNDGSGASPGTELLTFHGANVNGLAAWQAASGQDANSFEVEGQFASTLLSGTYSDGDFRLTGTGPGAAAAAISAGPQNHWDWNARASASGPPSSWPTVPLTIADALTYAANPIAWTW